MMKKTFLILCAALCSLGLSAQHTLRLMTYNIKNATGMDNVCNYARVADILRKADAEAIAVQEVDSMTQRSQQRYVLGELAERTGLHAYFAPAIDFDGGKYGIGLLTRHEPLRVERYALPGREEARALLIAEFEEYCYACTHLSLTEEDRTASLALIRQAAARYDKPFYLAGDLNALPDSPFLEDLKNDFQLLNNPKQATFPAPQPNETLDYIAVWKKTAGPIAVTQAQVLPEAVASDHRPVVVALRTAEKAEQIFRTRPYLQNPTGNGVTVMWETTVPAHCWVEYGTDTTYLERARHIVDGQVVCNNFLHKVRLNGLQPGQTYYYRVCSQEILRYQAYNKVFGHTAQSPFSRFTLPAADTEDFTALIFNDLHQQTPTFRALCQQVKDIPYDFVVFNGDCVDDPASHDQATRFISELTEGVRADRVPAFFLRGNHEIRNAYSIGLRDHYDYVDNRTYGAFNWGDTRIVVLDCGEDKPDEHWVYYGLNDFTQLRQEQVDFLKQEMRSQAFKKARKRILIHHIPLYGNDHPNLCEDLWKPLLQKAPFDVNLNAHTHQYAYHPAGELGNPFPVIIGGGYHPEDATVMVVSKRKNELHIRVLNTEGKTLLDLSL